MENMMGSNYPGNPGSSQVATLAGGCFWCLEAIFDELKGVNSVVSGYSGGHVPDPTYYDVCTGKTGHAEAVQVSYDPSILSYHDLLTIFFTIHDPTSLHRQGSDVGSQYRSVIFYHDQDQEEIARQVIDEIEAAGIWQAPIVTEVCAFDKFYPAEDYHQEYFLNNGSSTNYCKIVIAPKVSKFRQKYAGRLKK
jgi:peptide-methionine (S)-S-oxide reductase